MCTCFLLGNFVCCDFVLGGCGFGKKYVIENLQMYILVKMQKSLENINALVLQFCEKL